VLGVVTQGSALAVTSAALATALATGLGAIPLAFATTARRSWLGIGNVVAAVLMVAASVMLFYEGGRSDFGKTVVGAVIGVVTIALAARWLGKREHWRFGSLRGVQARVALIFVAVMTVHSVSEGVGVGVAFGDGRSIGLLTALAIAVHNIPEGLAISLVLVPRGLSVFHAAGWSIVSSLPQPLLALPAFFFVEAFAQALPIGLGFAGGAMLWMVVAQMVPDALRLAGERKGIAFH
jgi:zinc transporter, ZIP family